MEVKEWLEKNKGKVIFGVFTVTGIALALVGISKTQSGNTHVDYLYRTCKDMLNENEKYLTGKYNELGGVGNAHCVYRAPNSTVLEIEDVALKQLGDFGEGIISKFSPGSSPDKDVLLKVFIPDDTIIY